MKKLFLGALLALGFTGPVSATVLTFDDVGTGNLGIIPDGYGGFNWGGISHIGYVEQYAFPGSGAENAVVSGDYAAYNVRGSNYSSIDLIGAGTFDYVGAYWTSGWVEEQEIAFYGLNDGSLLYSSGPYIINKQTPSWIELNWFGIDQLVVGNALTQWGMDNFTFNNEIQVSAVPLPAAAWLFGSALLGFVTTACRRKFS